MISENDFVLSDDDHANAPISTGSHIPISKMQTYINELVSENKALKERVKILEEQNMDLLTSLEK